MARRCPVCRSKQWHKEPSSGLLACSEGHVLQNYRNEAVDAGEELGPHTMRKRALKSRRKRKEGGSKADPKLYHGARARYFFFQCQQLILRQQITALSTLWSLPPEFEIICRDLWAIHLNLLPSPPPAEPFFHAQEFEENTAPEQTLRKTKDLPPDAGSGESSPSSSEPEDEDETAESISSSSEADSVDTTSPKSIHATSRKTKRTGRQEALASTVVVLILACWTMRIPVIYMDFIRLIESYKLPYLDPIRLLPHNMTVHLTKHMKSALSPPHSPNTLTLHSMTSRLAKLGYATYKIFTPEINAAPVLWRAVKWLGGTPTLYGLTKRLSHVLSLPLTLHHTLAPSLNRIKKRDPESHKFDNVPPELALSAAAVIVLKMVYGLDGRPRPTGLGDAACDMPKLEDYLALLKELDEADAKTQDQVFNSRTPMLVDELSDDMLDQYLEFCEFALLPKEPVRETVPYNYFPLRHGSRVAENVNLTVVPSLSAPNVINEEHTLHPGQSYIIYSSRDVSGSLPKDFEMVSNRAARWVGVSDDYFYRVMERFERRLAKWCEEKKKRRREKNENESEEE